MPILNSVYDNVYMLRLIITFGDMVRIAIPIHDVVLHCNDLQRNG